MPSPWLSLLVAAVTGGLMGAIVNILYSWRTDKRTARIKQEATIASLMGELRRSRALCVHNGNLKLEQTAPFIRFPTTVALRATFEERHSYPRLRSLHNELEDYTMTLLHINQLMDLHDLLWISPVIPTSTSGGAQALRGKLQHQIADLCTAQEKLTGVGPENFIVVPSFIDHVMQSIERLE